MLSKTSYRNDIQSLRAVAVLSVLIFHYNKHILPGGFVGVDIFFVISGYLITSIILAKKESNSFDFLAFYYNRVKRIVPAYLILLVSVSIPAIALFMAKDLLTFRGILFHAFIFNSNNYIPALINDYFGVRAEQAPLLHTWTLSIEMQFYLIFPLILFYIPRNWNRFIFPALIALFTVYTQFEIAAGYRQDMYFSLLARAPEFLVGSIVVLWRIEEKVSYKLANTLSIIGIVILAYSFLTIDELSDFPGIYALIPAAGTAFLLLSKSSWINNFSAVGPLVFIGELSYSIYLWHWPVFSLIRYYSGGYILSLNQTILAITLIALLSWISYKCIEIPFRAIKDKKRFLLWITMPAICLMALGIFSKTINARILSIPNELSLRDALGLENHNVAGPIIVRGDIDSKRELLLLGDSHALHLNPFFELIGKENHFRFVSMTFDRFINVPTFDITKNSSSKTDIDNWNKQQVNLRELIKRAKVIVIGGLWMSDIPERTESLDQFFKSLSPSQEVVVVSDVPLLSEDPIRHLRFEKFGLTMTPKITDTYKPSDYQYLFDIIAKYPNVHFLDLRNSELLKTKDFPYYRGQSLYYDTNHLNVLGSRLYAKSAQENVMKLLDPLLNRTTDPEITPTKKP